MHSTLVSRLSTGLSLFLLAPLATSQNEVPPPSLTYRDYVTFDMAVLAGPGIAHEDMAFGEFEGQSRGSLLHILDGQLYRSIQPYLGASLEPLGLSLPAATAITVLPDQSLDGHDVAIIAEPSGLQRIEWQWLVPNTVGFFHSQPLSGSVAWADAARLIAAPKSPGGPLQLWCLSADRRSIRSGIVSGGSFTESLVFSAPFDIHDFTTIDWDGDATLDLAYTTGRGLLVHSGVAGHPLLAADLVITPSTAVTAFRTKDGSGDSERLAFAYEVTHQGAQEGRIKVVGPNQTETVQVLSGTPSPMIARAIEAGDFDADGSEDILISGNYNKMMLLKNQATTGAHLNTGIAGRVMLDISSNPNLPVVGTNPRPVFADIDGEPGEEILAFHDTEDAGYLFSTNLDLSASHGSFNFTAASSNLVSPATLWADDLDPDALLLFFDLPESLWSDTMRDYSFIQITCFHQASPSDPTFNALAYFNTVFPLGPDPAAGSGVSQKSVILEPERPGVPGVLNADIWPDADHIWIEYRFLKEDGLGNPDYGTASRAFLSAYTLRPDSSFGSFENQTYIQYLQAITPTSSPIGLNRAPNGDNAYVGFLLDEEEYPPLPPGTTLRRPVPTLGSPLQ